MAYGSEWSLLSLGCLLGAKFTVWLHDETYHIFSCAPGPLLLALDYMLVVCLRHIRVRLEEHPLLPLHHLQHYAVGVIPRSWSCSIRVAAAAGIIGTKSTVVQCGAEQGLLGN